jgi:hypothetical protein
MLDIKTFSTVINDSSLDIITVDEKFYRSKRSKTYILDMFLITYFRSGCSFNEPANLKNSFGYTWQLSLKKHDIINLYVENAIYVGYSHPFSFIGKMLQLLSSVHH